MADETKRAGSAPLSEHARRADALSVARKRERDLYDELVRNVADFSELDELHRGSPLEDVKRQLSIQHKDALDSIESDRAVFREAVAEDFEANWRLRRSIQRLYPATFTFAALWLLVALGAQLFYEIRFSPKNLAISFAFVWLLGFSYLRSSGGLQVIERWRERREAALELDAAERLLKMAIRETALPAQLRRIRQEGWRMHPPPDLQEGVSQRPDALPAAESEAADRQPPLDLSADSRLPPINPRDLVERYDSSQQLATVARLRLKALVDALGSASLGIAGPRGVGKTSLLRWFFSHQFNASGHLAVRISAPVRYEPRDFVLSAFAQVCEAVMGGREVPTLASRTRFFSSAAAAVLGVATVAAGIVVYEISLHVGGSTRHLVGAGLIAAGGLLLLLRFSPRARTTITPRYLSNTRIRDSKNPDEIAPQLFNEISFQLTFATGYSGKLSAGPTELAAETSYSLAARQQSFPVVVGRFRAFLETVARQRGKLYIGIDELDKMPVEDAVRFLDDIRGIFGVANCFFIVCVSEDALGQFELRGLPIRDAFDSSFDEVIRIDPLRVDESIAMLQKRTDIDSFPAAICHALAAGLPREVIRYARRLAIHSQRQITVGEAVALLLHQDLRERARGMSAPTDDEDTESSEAFRRLRSAKPIASDQLVEIAGLVRASHATLGCLALIDATIQELTTADPTSLLERADLLAAIRLETAQSPLRAWARCMELRSGTSLTPVVID